MNRQQIGIAVPDRGGLSDGISCGGGKLVEQGLCGAKGEVLGKWSAIRPPPLGMIREALKEARVQIMRGGIMIRHCPR